MKSKQEIVKEVKGWFESSPDVAKEEFLETPFDKLISYHSSLGRAIRNEFSLWEATWTPDLVEGADCSQEHPDAVSMNIIETVWRELHDSN